MDPVHRIVDLFQQIFNRKIILKFIKNPKDPVFYRKAPIVYFIYVLIPAILQKQPQAFLKLYFSYNFAYRSLYKIYNYD
jgi:hypothetical protein